MKTFRFFVFAVLALTLQSQSAYAGGGAELAFERLKALAGTWETQMKDGRPATTQYVVTANGTALREQFGVRGTDSMNMETMYHLDGNDLVLTHYCVAGNQPRMRADLSQSKGDTLTFVFQGATNLKDPNAGHMHRAIFKFVDKNTMIQEWTFRQNGSDAYTEIFELRRK